MLKHRVIPCLLLKDGGLVKTRQFRNPKYVGDPINAIRIFNEKEVDELMLLDIEASKLHREPNYALIEQCAGECFMPLCYGGGIARVEHAKQLFALGVEKITLQTGAIDNLDLVRDVVDRYGSQAVVVSIDVKKGLLGRYRLRCSATGKLHRTDWKEFMNHVVDGGAGEILVTSVDREGTLSGMDIALIEAASQDCPVPVIASGGASSLADLRAAVDAGASAVAAGAMFVFHGPHRAVLITYPKYQELESLLDA